MIILTVEEAKEIIDILGSQRFLLRQSNLDNDQKKVFSGNIDKVIEILLKGKNG